MEDEWEEEEEQLVVAELSGMIDSDALRKCSGSCKVVAVDSERPIMQLGRYVFAGEYEDAACTCVIFQEAESESVPGRQESCDAPALKYMCHTAKKLMLQRTFLSEQKEGEPSGGAIEILTLNEGKIAGRNSTVCHYIKDPEEPEPDTAMEHEDSDTEMA